jgi:uncharacterized protein (TIGR02271 family)
MTFESTGRETSAFGQPRTITAFFDRREDAEEAFQELLTEGFASHDVQLIPGAEQAAGNQSTPRSEPQGFWASLGEIFLPDEDRSTYAEGLSRGGYLVIARATGDNYDAALDILDREGTIDMDARSAEWRSAGWTGYENLGAPEEGSDSALARGGIVGPTGGALDSIDETSRMSLSEAAETLGIGDTEATPRNELGAEQVIPVAEERLRVGKRDVGHGRVRVRSYVVETPVEEDVQLREERVSIDRRSVDRPVASADDVFQDRSIEVEERAEEAVVGKDVRVTEELVIGKEETVRTEKVSDSVRHTEVEVSDERGSRVRDADVTSGVTRKAGSTRKKG